MSDGAWGTRDRRGNWHPAELIKLAPLFIWPPKPLAFLRWLFGFPGYFFPWNASYAMLSTVTWLFFTPALDEMKAFQFDWIAFVFGRNLALLSLVVGAWHFGLYVQKTQQQEFKYHGRWLARDNPVFLFHNQLLDNMFWTIASAWPLWSAYEVVLLWAFTNKIVPTISWAEHPIYCTVLMCLIPSIHDVHFFLIHRLIHWPPLYRSVHYLHHKNVNVGPWSGLSMHPIEHLLYFSGCLIYFLVPANPLHMIFHLQYAALAPSQGHCGFERILIAGRFMIPTGNYMHQLHHDFFECNYGGTSLVPCDRLADTFHDGSAQAEDAINKRFLDMHRTKRAT